MPELPEVETTTRGLKSKILGLKITGVWTDLSTKDKRQMGAIANPKFFTYFKNEILNKKVLSVERRAKNILINISGDKTILVHLKMTGHLLYGKYKSITNSQLRITNWVPAEQNSPLSDPYNRFVHVVFIFSNDKNLAFSDARKFGKITLLDPEGKSTSYGAGTKTSYLAHLGPEPLDKKFVLKTLKECLNKKPTGKIKTVLMDQSIIAGIGNIYSDEILWRAGVHPERKVLMIKESGFRLMFKAIKETLAKGIDFGGDSMSDYRNINGLPGKFQLHHEAYRRTGEKCRKLGCKGIIKRKVINGRSAHFCSVHQK